MLWVATVFTDIVNRCFTVGKVDVFGDFVPGAVVEVADLLFVLHHVGRLASFFVLHCDVILDRLEIFSMLSSRVMERMQRSQQGNFFSFVCTSDGFLPRRAPRRSYFCPLRSTIPTVDGLSSGYQPARLYQWTPDPWMPWTLLLWSQPQAPTVRHRHGKKSHSLLPCCTEKNVKH